MQIVPCVFVHLSGCVFLLPLYFGFLGLVTDWWELSFGTSLITDGLEEFTHKTDDAKKFRLEAIHRILHAAESAKYFTCLCTGLSFAVTLILDIWIFSIKRIFSKFHLQRWGVFSGELLSTHGQPCTYFMESISRYQKARSTSTSLQSLT